MRGINAAPALVALGLALTTLPAGAATVADGTASAGCTCVASPLEPHELSLAHDIDTPAGGDGQCAGPLAPEDGLWAPTATIQTMACGSGAAMLKQIIAANMAREKPARITWGGNFDAETWRRAWLAANPAPEAGRPKWTRVAEVEPTGSERIQSMTSRYRMVLLTPRSFRMEWTVEGRNEEGPAAGPSSIWREKPRIDRCCGPRHGQGARKPWPRPLPRPAGTPIFTAGGCCSSRAGLFSSGR